MYKLSIWIESDESICFGLRILVEHNDKSITEVCPLTVNGCTSENQKLPKNDKIEDWVKA